MAQVLASLQFPPGKHQKMRAQNLQALQSRWPARPNNREMLSIVMRSFQTPRTHISRRSKQHDKITLRPIDRRDQQTHSEDGPGALCFRKGQDDLRC